MLVRDVNKQTAYLNNPYIEKVKEYSNVAKGRQELRFPEEKEVRLIKGNVRSLPPKKYRRRDRKKDELNTSDYVLQQLDSFTEEIEMTRETPGIANTGNAYIAVQYRPRSRRAKTQEKEGRLPQMATNFYTHLMKLQESQLPHMSTPLTSGRSIAALANCL